MSIPELTEPAPMEWGGPARFLPPPPAEVRPDESQRYLGITYAAPAGYRPLQLDLWVPAGTRSAPLVVWIHGGAWILGDRRYLPETLRPDQIFESLVAAGLAVATVDYRFAREASFPAQLHDVKAAVRYLRANADALGLDVTRIGVWGESAGGHLAALLGLTADRADLEGDLGVVGPSSAVDVVVDWYGVSDPQTVPPLLPPPGVDATWSADMTDQPLDLLLAGADAATRADVSPVNHVGTSSPPFLLIHGTADNLVPFAQSEALAAALRAADVSVQLVPVRGADHIFLGHNDIDALVALSVDYLSTALTTKEAP